MTVDLEALRALATEGTEVHCRTVINPNPPELVLCEGVIAMADEIERLRAENAALREDIDLLRARAPRAYILTRKEEWLRLFRETYGYLKTCHRQHGTDLAGRDHAMKALIEAQLYLAPEDERAIKIAAYHVDLAVEKPAIDAALGEPR